MREDYDRRNFNGRKNWSFLGPINQNALRSSYGLFKSINHTNREKQHGRQRNKIGQHQLSERSFDLAQNATTERRRISSMDKMTFWDLINCNSPQTQHSERHNSYFTVRSMWRRWSGTNTNKTDGWIISQLNQYGSDQTRLDNSPRGF